MGNGGGSVKTWCTNKFCHITLEMYGYRVEAETWAEAQKVADAENKGTVIGELIGVIPMEDPPKSGKKGGLLYE